MSNLCVVTRSCQAYNASTWSFNLHAFASLCLAASYSNVSLITNEMLQELTANTKTITTAIMGGGGI